MMVNGQDDFISIYPLNTFPTHAKFLKPKYSQVKSITLTGFGYSVPETIEDYLYLLEDLPSGFIKNYEYGLGLQKDYRFIINSIEHIPEIEHVVISYDEKTGVKDEFFTINHHDFETIRKAINRITNGHQRDGIIEKRIFSYNALIHPLDPLKYKEKRKPYKNDVIYKFISSTSLSSSPLSKDDAGSVIDVLSETKADALKHQKEKILQLQNDIELLNLESLLDELEKLISSNSSEPKCQTLLTENPFILSLAFGYPVLLVQDQAAVGGRKLSGAGDKITDFLIKNNLTNNTALVEIKKPGTELLQKREYRSGVYGPSKELTESVTQILDQKYKFQKEIIALKDNTGIYDIESYAVDCILIAGVIPEEKEKKKCYELYRANLKDVGIFTFDELLIKLKNLYELLKG